MTDHDGSGNSILNNLGRRPLSRRDFMKGATLLGAGVVLAPAVTGCGGDDTGPAGPSAGPSSAPSASADVLTAAELAEFDGKDGRAAYVAVDGVVYDVTDSSSWPEGVHTRCNLDAMAGRDLSAEIQQAPSNMRSLLEQMPVVGRLE